MCAHLNGKDSWFLPFNKGRNDGAGNPPNPDGVATDYLWKEILSKERLTDVLENYAQIVVEKDEKTGKKKRKQIFPRYHQLAAVRKLLAHAREIGVGKRYLIQHSAGSGKSNSIAWLAHQMVGLEKDKKPVFDSIIVVTNRRILDKQIRDTIKSFAQVGNVVGHAERSGDLRRFISEGKQIIITTVQKFPFVLTEIGDDHRQNKFAIIIDEAHSGQGGSSSSKMNMALAAKKEDYQNQNECLMVAEDSTQYFSKEKEEETAEDKVNKLMESRKMLTNASYFAFTATPKNKTLEIFGEPDEQPDGKVRHHPFHGYTMKQAIQEGFILDVLKNYTPINSYYRLARTVEDDPLFDAKKAKKKLRKYVESNSRAIREKAEIMVDHFHEQVAGRRKIGGRARAMVVTSSIMKAVKYFHAINEYLDEKKLPYKTIVAFSGEHEYGERKVTEALLNGFPTNKIEDRIAEDPYRILIVADKFLTGYDEPLKLPAPKVDMDSYRAEVQAAMDIDLTDEEGEVVPVPTESEGGRAEPELDQLSNIIKDFNELFGNLDWKDADKVIKVIAEEIPEKVAADSAYRNAMKNSDRQNARIEHDKALNRVMLELITIHTDLFKQFSDNQSFKTWMGDKSFGATYQSAPKY